MGRGNDVNNVNELSIKVITTTHPVDKPVDSVENLWMNVDISSPFKSML